MSLFDLLHAANHRPDTTVYRWTQGVLWCLIAGSIALFGVELWVPDLPQPWDVIVAWGDTVVLWIFGLDLVVRVGTYQPPQLKVFVGSYAWRLRTHILGRLRYLVTPEVFVDLITVLALVPALRGLRALRLLRLLKGVHLFRYSNPIVGVFRSFAESWLLYFGSLGFLVVTVLLSGVSLYLIEGRANPSIDSIGDGIWWALVTITTVGFGDITPITPAGRMLGAVVMVAGMFTLALFAGIVSATLLNVMFRLREEAFRMSTHVNHIVVCGYDSGARMLLDALLEELDSAQRPEVLLFAPSERPEGVPDEFTWVRGDPTKEGELDKGKLASARSIIVVASRDRSIQEADATTLLTLFTLRSYMAKQALTARRENPLHVTAEVLDQENVEHAYAAGANEVIETTRLGFSMVAHSVTAPGAGQILAEVVSAKAASIFVGTSPLTESTTFDLVQAQILKSHAITVVGFKGEGRDVQLNPAADKVVRPGADLVYLAKHPVL